MKALTFTYTKKDGSVSERTLLAMVTPTDKYAGIDVSELDPNAASEFITKAEALHLEYIRILTELQKEYDVVHNYRQFIASGMSDIVAV
jgi:hypothetical protein